MYKGESEEDGGGFGKGFEKVRGGRAGVCNRFILV